VAVLVTELTLAAARDTIRVLSWMKSNAPATRMLVVGNRIHAASPEISRKDFETSIERKIDYIVPFDQKLAAQAAKLGKPLAEAGRASKTVAPLLDLTRVIAGLADETADAPADAKKGKGGTKADKPAKEKGAAPGSSLMAKFGDLKGLIPRKGGSK
jgi:pilus assembly protein CpaE